MIFTDKNTTLLSSFLKINLNFEYPFMIHLTKCTFIIIFFSLTIVNIFGQIVIPDNSFGEEGKLIVDFEGENTHISYLVNQPDGKILLSRNSGDGFILNRFNEFGELDNNFGENGQVEVNLASFIAFSKEIIIQKDRKILIIGYARDSIGIFHGFMVRYNENGLVDDTFGENGQIIIDFMGEHLITQYLIESASGKIIIAGSDNNSIGGIDFVLMRYHRDGSLDISFGENGRVITRISGNRDIDRFVTLQGDGKILLGGYVETSPENNDFVLLRYFADGQIDKEFGVEGIVDTDFDKRDDKATHILVQPDGKTILIGTSVEQTKEDFAMVRYDENGQLDETFGDKGRMVMDLSGYASPIIQTHDIPAGAVLKTDGKVLILGSMYQVGLTSSDKKIVLVQYNQDGGIDKEFGENGIFELDLDRYFQLGQMILRPDGKLIIGGDYYKNGYSWESNIFLASYITDFNVGTINFSTMENNALIYPNPIKNTATLEYTLENPEKLTIQLININGQILKTYLQDEPQKVGDYQQEITLPNDLPKGFYLVRIASENGQIAIKVVK